MRPGGAAGLADQPDQLAAFDRVTCFHHALGLMQVTLQTGEMIANRLGAETFNRERLFERVTGHAPWPRRTMR